MQPGLVSIIIPTCNRAQLVAECVTCVLAQTYATKEIIVIDDGSTDDTALVLARFGNQIHYIRQDNQGASTARQRGIESARGEFLSFLDSDDLWDAQYLAQGIAALTASGAGLAFANNRITDRQGHILITDESRANRPYLETYRQASDKQWHYLSTSQARDLFLRHLPGYLSGMILRRELLKHPFEPRIRFGEDRLFLTDFVLDSNCAVTFTWDCLVTMRIHGGNIFQGNPNVAEIAPDDILVNEQILQHHATTLTAAETHILHSRIAADYFNWGYYAAKYGTAGKAWHYYWLSFRQEPRLLTLVAALKVPALRLLKKIQKAKVRSN